MKRRAMCAAFALIAVTAGAAAETPFSARLSPEEFASAGLTKLNPAELARLDGLVRDVKAGAEQRAADAEAQARAARAAAEDQQKAEADRLAQLKEKLSTRAAIEMEPLETNIKGRFTGWQGKTVFYLENGERWQVANSGSSYYTPAIDNPRVRIEPASMGGFWMTVVAVNQRVRVTPLGKR